MKENDLEEPSPVPTLTRLTRAELIGRIREWQDDDKQGYDTAIGLLCEAGEQLAEVDALLCASEEALRELLKEWRNERQYMSPEAQVILNDCIAELGQLLTGPGEKP